ncbi:MAG: hypothetical protein NC177_12805 [Ruminococcus flavefaciens]|nr:hypothetical protein [Ruminococcus flavefaciens]
MNHNIFNVHFVQMFNPFDSEIFSRDFCINHLEIIMPVCDSISEVITVLETLDSKARTIIKEQDETFLLYNNAPHIDSENEIQIAQYNGILSAKHDYRIILVRRYGKRIMLYLDIHFNFSLKNTIGILLLISHTP